MLAPPVWHHKQSKEIDRRSMPNAEIEWRR